MSNLLEHLRLPFLAQHGSSIVSLFVLLVSMLVVTKLIAFIIKQWQISCHFRNSPSLPGFSPLYYVLGNVEVVYLFFSNISRSKALFRLIESMFQLEPNRSKGYFCFSIGFDRLVALFHESTIEDIITSTTQIDKSFEYGFFRDWLGQGLLTSTGAHWKLHRKLLTPGFHFRILESFGWTMNENVTEMLDIVERDMAKQDNRKRGLDIRSYINNCTLDTICETAMGTRVGAQAGDVEYTGHITKTLEMILARIMLPLYRWDFFWNLSPMKRKFNYHLSKVHGIAMKVIEERREEMKRSIANEKLDIAHLNTDEIIGKKKRRVFLDSLLLAHFQDPEAFTLRDILDEVSTFMLGGQDTTSSALTLAILLIASDQKVQDKIYEELMSVLDDDTERPIGLDDSRQLKYLEMVIKESLRLYPSVPFIARKLTEPLKLKEQTIPAGSTAMIIPYLLHRDATNFPQPEKFSPERWQPEASIHKRLHAYLPFSAGPRNCIGQKFAMLELKIVIGSMVRRFHLKAITHRLDIDIEFQVLMRANSPVNICFERREEIKH